METGGGGNFADFYKDCFEPTYKEWKRSLKYEEIQAEARFEPTYKEWKLLKAMEIIFFSFAF